MRKSVVIAAFLFVAADPQSDDVKKEMEKLEGS
jgi:hypothetical protein